jgi:hypothetical protein
VSDLVDYVRKHAQLAPRSAEARGTDVYFFTVKAAPGSSGMALRDLILKHKGAHVEVDLFDGNEHGYIELGAWLDSQEVALALIGLGTELELWKLLSPRTMLSRTVPAELEERLVGQGYLSLQAYKQ